MKCEMCGSNFDPSVLEMTRQQHAEMSQQQFSESLFRAAVLMVVQTERVSEREIAELLRIGGEELELDIDRLRLGQLCSQANTSGVKPADYLHSVSGARVSETNGSGATLSGKAGSGGWNQSQKRQAIQVMFQAASADGDMTAGQIETLRSISDRWGFTDREFQDAILAVTDVPA